MRKVRPNLLVGLNNDAFSGWKTVTIPTGFGGNVHLHDYSGHAGDVWTDQWGNVTIGIPPNDNGTGYVCYSRAGMDKPNEVPRWATTQVFEGAEDLDIGPAREGEKQLIGRIWCDSGVPVHLNCETDGNGLTFNVTDSEGSVLDLHNGITHTHRRGWHMLHVESTAGTKPYKLAVTYTSTQFL